MRSGRAAVARPLASLALGVLAVVAAVAGTTLGGGLDAIAAPPALIRAFLAAAAIVVGLGCLARGLVAIEQGHQLRSAIGPSEHSRGAEVARELPAVLGGIRFVFLAAASFAAATGWIVGHPLPIIVALVIAGVDVAETSFLLVVAAASNSEDA
jgi:hypothetical protein